MKKAIVSRLSEGYGVKWFAESGVKYYIEVANMPTTNEAIAYLKQNGVDCAIINLGGNVLLVGEKPDGSAFNTGIHKPA